MTIGTRQAAIPEGSVPLSSQLEVSLRRLKTHYEDCSDVMFQQLISGETEMLLVYIDGLSSKEEIERCVLAPLRHSSGTAGSIQELARNISAASYSFIDTFEQMTEHLSDGHAVLLADGSIQALSVNVTSWPQRAIEEPKAETVVRGPREGFVETLQVNMSLIRRRLKKSNLKFKQMKAGRQSESTIVVAYLAGIADPKLIQEVRSRIERIDADAILDSAHIEEWIEDNPYSPFPQLLATERPDVACAGLLEGRVVILLEGTPFVLIAPTTFFTLFQSPEDYYQRYMTGTFLRWLRYLFAFVALFGPSLYVSILSFHHEMIPAALLLTIVQARDQVPFPALIEALIMEVFFEALREAGIRLPKQIGSAVSIVGGLVIGQAAIQAGIVSAGMVIVVSITGIASFLIPHFAFGLSLRLLRFPMIFLAGTLGLLGILLGGIMLVTHLHTLRSFGEPYLAPVTPLKLHEWKDVLVRAPRWLFRTRPHFTGRWNAYRQPYSKPDPHKKDE